MLKIADYKNIEKMNKMQLDNHRPAGRYAVEFDGSDLSSGFYFYKLEAEGFREVKKMLFIK